VFAGRDVTAIALQLPDTALGDTRLSLSARISVLDHVPPRQVNRIGQAMFRPLFFNAPDNEAEMDALNAASPTPGPGHLRRAGPCDRQHHRPADRAAEP